LNFAYRPNSSLGLTSFDLSGLGCCLGVAGRIYG
jgi:hypothetical protein